MQLVDCVILGDNHLGETFVSMRPSLVQKGVFTGATSDTIKQIEQVLEDESSSFISGAIVPAFVKAAGPKGVFLKLSRTEEARVLLKDLSVVLTHLTA